MPFGGHDWSSRNEKMSTAVPAAWCFSLSESPEETSSHMIQRRRRHERAGTARNSKIGEMVFSIDQSLMPIVLPPWQKVITGSS